MDGEFTKSGLLRISSVIELPHLALDGSGPVKPKVDPSDPKLYATQNHYRAVQSLLRDIRNKKHQLVENRQVEKRRSTKNQEES